MSLMESRICHTQNQTKQIRFPRMAGPNSKVKRLFLSMPVKGSFFAPPGYIPLLGIIL
jgi:hypothetical protein